MSRKERRAHLQPGFKNERPKPKSSTLQQQSEEKEEKLTDVEDLVPEVSSLDCAFPSRHRDLLPRWDDLSADEKCGRGPYCAALNELFFNGGKLSEHGITPKPGYDLTKIMRYIRATLGDFGPRHEHKIGGIAHMLAKWCDVTPKENRRRA